MASKIENFDIVGSYNQQRVLPLDPERTLNMFEYVDALGKKQKNLISTSGIITRITFASGVSRATFVFQGVGETDANMYQVFGADVYRIDKFLAQTLIFSFTSGLTTGYVGVDANTHEVIFVDGIEGWVWNTTTSIATKIVDVNFPVKPIDVCNLDGYFVVANGDTNQFVLSQINDGTNYTPLQQGAITAHPGNIVACRTLHRRLFLFSLNFTEVWENTGASADLPFRRNNSLLLEYGTPAVGSISVSFDMMAFQSQTKDGLGPVIQLVGTQSIPISTNSIDNQFSMYDSLQQISDCRAFLIKENGLIFYRMNFTAANNTWIYNVTLSNPQSDSTKFWHEEQTLEGNRHPTQTHGYFFGNNYAGSYLEPKTFLISSDILTNDGEDIKRMRISRSFVPPGYQRTRIDRFQLDLLQGSIFSQVTLSSDLNLLTETGINILAETGDELLLQQQGITQVTPSQVPTVFLSISRDGGQTFGYKIPAPMGAIGERAFRTVWRKLGVIPRGQGFVVKIEFYNEYPFAILGAAWSYEVEPE